MKKLNIYAALVLSLFFVSCNNSSKSEKDNVDAKSENSELNEKEPSVSENSVREGIWVKGDNIGKADFIKKGDFQYYMELKKSGDSWKLSIPCDMETLEFNLEQDGNSLKNKKDGISLDFDGKNLKLSGDAVAACQTVAKNYAFLPDCKVSDYTALAGFFRGEYKATDATGVEFDVKLEAVGIMSGWKQYTSYKYNTLAADPVFELREAESDEITILVVEVNNDNISLFECNKCEDMMELDANLNKGKKVLTLKRK